MNNDEMLDVFAALAMQGYLSQNDIQNWEQIHEPNLLKKKKKFCDYLLRKGWEHSRILDWLNEQNV
jgi:hypothetical protein